MVSSVNRNIQQVQQNVDDAINSNKSLKDIKSDIKSIIKDGIESVALETEEQCQEETYKTLEYHFKDLKGKLYNCDNISQIFRAILPEVSIKLKPQLFSLYLLSKENRLVIQERAFFPFEISEEKQEVWLKDESHAPGENFTGRAIIVKKGQAYGDSYCDNNLDYTKLEYGKLYKNKLTFLKNGLSAPLNGVRRTLGTIEAINRINNQNEPDANLKYYRGDENWLKTLGEVVSDAVNRLRKKWKEDIIAEINFLANASISEINEFQQELEKKLDFIHISEEQHKYSIIYNYVAHKLIHDYLPFKVCIVRVLNPISQCLDVAGIQGTPDIKMEKRKNISRKKHENGVVAEVFRTGKKREIRCIEKEKHLLLSTEWIDDQDTSLESLVCVPLIHREIVVGTISLFTSYQHDYNHSDNDFINSLSNALALFTRTLDIEEGINKSSKGDIGISSIDPFELSLEDIYGLIIDDINCFRKFNHNEDNIKFLNKELLVCLLGNKARQGNNKSLKYLKMLMYHPTFINLERGSANFQAVEKAVREYCAACQDNKKIIRVLTEILRDGNYAAKFAASRQATLIAEESLVVPIKQAIEDLDSSLELQNYLKRQLENLEIKLKAKENLLSTEQKLESIKVISMSDSD